MGGKKNCVSRLASRCYFKLYKNTLRLDFKVGFLKKLKKCARLCGFLKGRENIARSP